MSKDEIDNAVKIFMEKWSTDSKFRDELRKDPQKCLETEFQKSGVPIDKDVQNLIKNAVSKVKGASDKELETLKSKSSGLEGLDWGADPKC